MTIKIIDGRRYNTDTATAVASEYSYEGISDFRWFEETLYRTPKGAWFTCGGGNAMSRYSQPAGLNSWSGSRDVIRALSARDAQRWLTRNNATDALEEYFAAEIVDA